MLVLFTNNTLFVAEIIGFIALTFSYLTIKLVKGCKIPVILFSIIFYINLSVYVLGPLTGGVSFSDYQSEIWNSKYDAIGTKCLLITSSMFFCALNRTKVVNKKNCVNISNLKLKRNKLLSLAIMSFVAFISMYGFTGSVGDNYESNSNPLFEYAVLFMILAWYYGGSIKICRLLWGIVAVFYIGVALLAGDRSSSFMLLLLIALYVLKNVSMRRMLTYAFGGILFANIIEMYRTSSTLSINTSEVFSRGLQTFFSNTAAQSYYTGLTIYYYLDDVQNSLYLFGAWIVTLFTGSAIIDRSLVDLSSLAGIYNYNGGGGLFQPYFYLFYGYIGVAIGSYITGLLLRKTFFEWKGAYANLLAFLITAMCFRWYLYTPTTLFRSCLINFGIIYLFFEYTNKLINRGK